MDTLRLVLFGIISLTGCYIEVLIFKIYNRIAMVLQGLQNLSFIERLNVLCECPLREYIYGRHLL